MTQPRESRIRVDRRIQRITAKIPDGQVPEHWKPVIAAAADFDPEDDAALLDWMNGEIMGVAGYAEALIDGYETLIGEIGLDPQALKMMHDVADAQSIAAETMHKAKVQFLTHYEQPRDFAAEGGLMPYDGRHITGQGS